jgi:serine/threonine protein kinase
VASTKTPRLQPGDVVGERYRIAGVVGRGGFGAVYRAIQTDSGAEVALKVLLKNFNSSQVDAKRFAREAALVQKLRHPNVVELLDFGTTAEGLSYIAFELLKGSSLSKALKTGGALPLYRAAQITRDILSALAAAHAMGIIHRDVKPGNVFLLEGSEEAKVLDFGIAKAVTGEEAADTQLTEAGQMIGTPHYMAPEQVRGTGVLPGTDVYAAGLLFAEMIAGERVVKGNALIDIYMTHISNDPVRLPESVADSPVGALIARSVAKLTDERYASAAEMIDELDRLMPGLQKEGARAAGVAGKGPTGTDGMRRERVLSDSSIDALAAIPSASREPLSFAPEVEEPEAATVMMHRPELQDQQAMLDAVISSSSPPASSGLVISTSSRRARRSSGIDATIDMDNPVLSPFSSGALSSSNPISSGIVSSGIVSSGIVSSGIVSSGIVSSGAVSSGAVSSGPVVSTPAPAQTEALHAGAMPAGAMAFVHGQDIAAPPATVRITEPPPAPGNQGGRVALALIIIAIIALLAAAVLMLRT